MVSAEGGAGHLQMGVCGAGNETKSFDNGFSEQEQSLIPALLREILKQIVSLFLDTVGVEIDIDWSSDRITVLAWKGKWIIRNWDDGQAIGLSFPG